MPCSYPVNETLVRLPQRVVSGLGLNRGLVSDHCRGGIIVLGQRQWITSSLEQISVFGRLSQLLIFI